MEREEFISFAKELLGDRVDDQALAFAKMCGDFCSDTAHDEEIAKIKAESEKQIADLKADNDRLRGEYRDLFFSGKKASPADFVTEPRKTADVERPANAIPALKLRGIQYDEGTIFKQ